MTFVRKKNFVGFWVTPDLPPRLKKVAEEKNLRGYSELCREWVIKALVKAERELKHD